MKSALRTAFTFPTCCRLWAVNQANIHVRCVATHIFDHHASALSILPSKVDQSSEDFKENEKQMSDAMASMQVLHQKIELGGPVKAREKHVARGKMLPREYVGVLPVA